MTAAKRIVICGTQRCGSTLLCNDLSNNSLGRPQEYFLDLVEAPETSADPDFLPRITRWGTSQNGVFAVKLMANYVAVVDQYLATQGAAGAADRPLSTLARFFSGANWIWMTRRDVVAQAVSQLMSRLTGVFHAVADDKKEFVPVKSMVGASEEYNEHISMADEAIREAVNRIDRENDFWQTFFRDSGIVPRRIVYEDILEDFSHVAAIRRDFGLPRGTVATTRNLVKLGNKHSDEIVRRYKDRQPAKTTP